METLKNQFSESITTYYGDSFGEFKRSSDYENTRREKVAKQIIKEVNNSRSGLKRIGERIIEARFQALQEREEKLKLENPQYIKKSKHQLINEMNEAYQRKNHEAEIERKRFCEEKERFWKENATRIAQMKKEIWEAKEKVEVEKEKGDDRIRFEDLPEFIGEVAGEIRKYGEEIEEISKKPLQEPKKKVDKSKSQSKPSKKKFAKVKVNEDEKLKEKWGWQSSKDKKEVDFVDSSEVADSSDYYSGSEWESWGEQDENSGSGDIYSVLGYDKEEWE